MSSTAELDSRVQEASLGGDFELLSSRSVGDILSRLDEALGGWDGLLLSQNTLITDLESRPALVKDLKDLSAVLSKPSKPLSLDEVQWLNNGSRCTSLVIGRTNGPNGSGGPHSAAAIPIFKNKEGTYSTAFVAQRRPATGNPKVLEFACGLTDGNETAVEAAQRELEEETGFDAGKNPDVWHESASCPKDSGLGFAAESPVGFFVDESKRRAPELEEEEKAAGLETLVVPLDQMSHVINRWTEHGRVSELAMGFWMGYKIRMEVEALEASTESSATAATIE